MEGAAGAGCAAGEEGERGHNADGRDARVDRGEAQGYATSASSVVASLTKCADDAISLTPTLRKSALEAVEASDDQIKDVLPRLGNGLIALASAPQTASTMPVELLQLVFDRNLDRLTAESDINHVRLALTEALLGDETSRKVCLASSTIGVRVLALFDNFIVRIAHSAWIPSSLNV